jgi:Na+-transporting methylmalonyl-CoA/oxaloacetate decarboxylase beta subunit
MSRLNFPAYLLIAIFISVLFNILWQLTTLKSAASVAIIGGADGPTAIFLTSGGASGGTLPLLALLPIILPGLCLLAFLIAIYPLYKKKISR